MIFRAAEPADAPQLAELMYIADLAHYATSGYAVSLGGTREHQLEQLARLAATAARSQFHSSHFDLAVDEDGTIAASVAGFDKAGAQAGEALLEIGWDTTAIQSLAERVSPLDVCFPADAPGTWTIEHVATRQLYRRRGLARQLLNRVLTRGAAQGLKAAAVDVFTGNPHAQALYETAGFRPVAIFGREPLRRIFNRDPLIRLTRSLG